MSAANQNEESAGEKYTVMVLYCNKEHRSAETIHRTHQTRARHEAEDIERQGSKRTGEYRAET